jgi:hypothetical protein
MGLKVTYGGMIRYGEPIVSSSESTQWAAGRVLKINSSNQVVLSTGASGEIYGVALRDRITTSSIGPTTSLTKVGAPTGERAEMLLSQAIISTDQLESGSSFVGGDTVYVGSNGKFADNSRKNSAQVAGKALTDGAAGDPNRWLTFFFDVQY